LRSNALGRQIVTILVVLVGAGPCVINVGAFNVPAHDFGQTPIEKLRKAKGELRKNEK